MATALLTLSFARRFLPLANPAPPPTTSTSPTPTPAKALAHAAGGRVVRAPEPVHGRLSRLRHAGHALFAGVPRDGGLDVVRYHSLVVDAAALPPELEAIAWTTGGHHAVRLGGGNGSGASAGGSSSGGGDGRQRPAGAREPEPGLIMALAHRSRPHVGVQFHPESVATRFGVRVIANFRDLAAAHCAAARRGAPAGRQLGGSGAAPRAATATATATAAPAGEGLDGEGPPGRAFAPRRDWLPIDGLDGATAGAGAGAGGAAAASASSVVGSLWHEEDAAATEAWPPADGLLRVRLCWRRLPGALAAAGGGKALFEELIGPNDDTFWLDRCAAV